MSCKNICLKRFHPQGEDISDAAVREVKEETGVRNNSYVSFFMFE